MPNNDELYELLLRSAPNTVRAVETARAVLNAPGNYTELRRDSAGRLIAALVMQGGTVYMLCVAPEARRRGIGSELLALAEARARSIGCADITIGAGDDYITPGVPTSIMPYKETPPLPPALYSGLDDSAARFFINRGYTHYWGNCNCFDMRAELNGAAALPTPPCDIDGVHYRFAEPADMAAVAQCVRAAHPPFEQYYTAPELYTPSSRQRVLAAERCGTVAGAIIVSLESEGAGIGSVGCTAVSPEHQGRGIGSGLTRVSTGALRSCGMQTAFLGYTYSGLERMYGRAGYRICVYYLMARKALS